MLSCLRSDYELRVSLIIVGVGVANSRLSAAQPVSPVLIGQALAAVLVLIVNLAITVPNINCLCDDE